MTPEAPCSSRLAADQGTEARFTRPKGRLRSPGCPALGYVDVLALAEGTCRYDLNEQDVAWLHVVNQEFCRMGENRPPSPPHDTSSPPPFQCRDAPR